MNKWVVVSIAGLALLGLSTVSIAEDEPDMAAQMEAMAKLAAPNEHHEHLQRMIGKWKVQSKFWMVPGADPMESEGTAEINAVMGGRFIQQQFLGDFMGQEFVGFGMEGFDNAKLKHIGYWADNMGTMMMSSEGQCSAGGTVTTTMSEFDDPASGQKLNMKAVLTQKDDKNFSYVAYMQTPEGEFKSMELIYTKK
jgi:hypothetical protein